MHALKQHHAGNLVKLRFQARIVCVYRGRAWFPRTEGDKTLSSVFPVQRIGTNHSARLHKRYRYQYMLRISAARKPATSHTSPAPTRLHSPASGVFPGMQNVPVRFRVSMPGASSKLTLS